jgi:hypothetical protein
VVTWICDPNAEGNVLGGALGIAIGVTVTVETLERLVGSFGFAASVAVVGETE